MVLRRFKVAVCLFTAGILCLNTGCFIGPDEVVVDPANKDLRIGDDREGAKNLSRHEGGLEVD